MKYPSYCLFLCLLFALLHSGCSTDQQKSENSSTNATTENTEAIAKPAAKKTILFFGNSLTAGYGLDAAESFPSLIQAKIDSAGYNYQVVNAGVSGETTAMGRNRVGWVLRRQPVDIFVLELGANDGLRGLSVKETKKNLLAIIDSVRAQQPQAQIMLAGMMIPPNMGPAYTREFQQVFPAIAKEKNTDLIPFLLQDVAGVDSLNLPDGVHPNATGEKLVARNVWAVLEQKLER